MFAPTFIDGRELLDGSSEEAFGQYRYERFDADQVARYVRAYVKITADWAITELGKPNLPPATDVPYHCASPRNCSVSFERTGISVAAVLESTPGPDLPHGVRTRFVLYAGQPWLDIEMTIKDKPADPWPEAGWIALPFQIEWPQFRLGRLGSVVDPAQDLVRGVNRHLFALEVGLTVTSPDGS